MLELPETYAFSRQLNELLREKEIQTVALQSSPHKFSFFSEDIDYGVFLQHQIIKKVYPIAAYIVIEFADQSRLVFRDGIRFYYVDQPEDLPPKHQLLLSFADGSFLACSTAMYGAMLYYEAGAEPNDHYFNVSASCPVPYDEAFDFAYFCSLIPETPKKMSLKAFLGTEQRIPGLGNGCMQDIFFQAGFRPRRLLASLDPDQLEKLYQVTIQTLETMKENGGRDTEKDVYGNFGGYQTILSKNTYKKGCQTCGTDIIKENYLGGTVYYCPKCQQ
ncbi:hypothetical protein ACYSNR_15435 [Enterococcus sp. LJL128]